jgi:hypothetical protein
LPLLAAALVLPAAPGVAAGGPSVVLKVKGPGTHHPARFCGKHKRVYVFARGAQLKYKGTVTPAPPKHFPVVVKVERCAGRHFRRVTDLDIVGGRGTGRFKAFFSAPAPGRARVTYFSAVAVVAGHRSNKRYFGIRR